MRPWISPSVRSFVSEAIRSRQYSLFDFLHGYLYARWPYLYISIGTGEHSLTLMYQHISKTWNRIFPRKNQASRLTDGRGHSTIAEGYHGKVLPFKNASRLITVKEDVHLTDLEQIIPYSRARDIILINPDHIVALDCPCRAARPNPCLPLDVCLIVGEPFASFVSEHHPHRSRWISPDEAVGILHGESQRGHVHHAFFKDAMLGRFYAICNCCSCCCGAIQAHGNGIPMLASSGFISKVDDSLCIGCGECIEVCQFSALSIVAGECVVDQAGCMGCGVCSSQCMQGALSLVKAPSKGEPLEIQTLIAAKN